MALLLRLYWHYFQQEKKEVRYLKGNSYICSPIREVAQLVSACVWGAQGRWFESSLPDTKNPTEISAGFYCLCQAFRTKCSQKSLTLVERYRITKIWHYRENTQFLPFLFPAVPCKAESIMPVGQIVNSD